VDGFRRAHKLYTVDDTRRWMKQRGMTHEQLEHYAVDAAVVDKVRDRITAGRVEDYFEKHQVYFDMAYIAQLTFSDKESAYRIYGQIQHGIIDFYEMAQQRFLETVEQKKHPGQDIFAIIQRGQVLSELAKVLFNAAPGVTLGPFHMEEHYAIVRVLSISRARLDERTRTAIKKILFEEWLAERRQAATIEWYWGNADRISQAD
jgi:putative peptide maturation system protein